MNSDFDRMTQMITGYWITQIVHAAATFSFADHLSQGPVTAEDIARAEGTDPSATFRLLRACASLGMVTYDGKSRFAATSLLNTLRKDSPKNLRGMALSWPAPGFWLPWGHFIDAVKSGKGQTVSTLGMEYFEYLATNPEEAAAFTEGMASYTSTVAEETARVIDTSAVEVVADIGGAGGAMLHALLRVHPDLRGILFDRPNVIANTDVVTGDLDFQKRVTAVGGDFLQSVPAADLYLLKHILHDWDDASCIRILKNCRQALRPGGRVVVIELALGEIGEPGLAPSFDMAMMVIYSARERSVGEYRQLFEAAGLRSTKIIPTNTPMIILEAVAG